MILRPYQQECLDAVWRELFVSRSALVVLPCGAGKTNLFIKLIEKSLSKKPDIQIVVLVQRVQLLEQTVKRIAEEINPAIVGVHCGSIELNARQITVATVQSVKSLNLHSINLIILDESHNTDDKKGRYFTFLEQEFAKNPKLKVVGFTASPYRHDGYIYGPDRLFKSVTYKRDLVEMINEGYLVPPRLKHSVKEFDVSKLRIRAGEYAQEDVDKLIDDTEKVREQILDALTRLADRKKIVWVCGNINHAEAVKIILNECGESAETVHSKQTDIEREQSLHNFQHKDARHLTNVSVLQEGYDQSDIDAIILMRPTRSPVAFVQSCGRALRPAPKKRDALILDYGHVVENLGSLNDPIIPKKGSKKLSDSKIKYCPSCSEFVPRNAETCFVCQHVFYKKPTSPTKNLSYTALDGDILSSQKRSPIQSINIRSVELSKFVSKNGNNCLRITYYSDDFLGLPHSEFFMWEAEWGRKKAYKRLIELNTSCCEALDDQVRVLVGKPPKKIWIDTREKYPRITMMDFL